MKKWKAAFVALIPSIIFVPWTSPALAHDVRHNAPKYCGTLGFQACGYGQVRDNHEIVDACDTVRDGTGVFVRYQLRSILGGIVNDGNGSKAGCGIKRVGSSSDPIVGFQVCAKKRPEVCSPWSSP